MYMLGGRTNNGNIDFKLFVYSRVKVEPANAHIITYKEHTCNCP